MDPIQNPYSPNAGAPPPALVGRDRLIGSFETVLGRVLAGRSEKSLLPTGLRGVGKTVLLNRFVSDAERRDFAVIQIEVSESGGFLKTLTAEVRSLLYRMDANARARDVVSKALGVLKSFALTYDLREQSVKLGVDAQPGIGDSGILNNDLTALFISLGEAARAQDRGVLIAIDEVQYLDESQLEAIIMAVHRVTQLVLPVLVIGTGLPQLPALAGNAKSYAERLFDYPHIGPLSKADAFEAIRKPASDEGVEFTNEALEKIYEITEGYPYFIQEWAYRVWNHAATSPIQRRDVDAVESEVLDNLDQSFFRVRYDRLTPAEKRYLRAMAELGAGPHRSGDIAAILGVKVESLGPRRSGLIRKGMIYSPQHGDTAFTVPLFDGFMKRTQPLT